LETLRVVMVSDWFPPRVGGVETSISELSKALGRLGHEVIVVTHENSSYRGPPGLVKGDGYLVYWIRARLLAKDDATYDPLAIAKASLFVKRNAVDVVHAHGVTSLLGLMTAMIASGGTGVPSVLTNHSLLSGSLRGLGRLCLRCALKWPTLLVGVSRAAAEDISRISGRPADVIHNCINVDSWRKMATWSHLDGDPAIVITSRLSPRKNPLEIAKVASLVARELPRARFYMVGDGMLMRDLVESLRSFGVEDRVKVLGLMPRERVAQVLSGADAFVLTSYRESFGIAVLEAMALGVPPLVYRSPGVLDLVEDGRSGVIVDGPEAMADAIVRVASDEGLRRDLARGAEDRARLFDCSIIARRYVEEYRRAEEVKCSDDRRFLAYRVYRALRGDPVKEGEWCRGRKWEYHERSANGIVPVVRRGAGRPAVHEQ
jgi:glycosyltransferase involved in cell wall biosynthesis